MPTTTGLHSANTGRCAPRTIILKSRYGRKNTGMDSGSAKDRSAPEQAGTTTQFATVAADDPFCDSLVQAGRCVWVPEELVRERQADGFVLYLDLDSRCGEGSNGCARPSRCH